MGRTQSVPRARRCEAATAARAQVQEPVRRARIRPASPNSLKSRQLTSLLSTAAGGGARATAVPSTPHSGSAMPHPCPTDAPQAVQVTSISRRRQLGTSAPETRRTRAVARPPRCIQGPSHASTSGGRWPRVSPSGRWTQMPCRSSMGGSGIRRSSSPSWMRSRWLARWPKTRPWTVARKRRGCWGSRGGGFCLVRMADPGSQGEDTAGRRRFEGGACPLR